MAQSAHNRYALGVDIGGSHVCSAVVDLATGQLCGEPHTDKVDAAAGARTIAGAWAANIRRTAAASGIGCIRCAGFAFPGPFDYERGISLIRGVRKFERIYGLDVAATLYPLLRRLEGQGLLTSEWETGGSKPRKYYRVTPEGREVCARLKAAWQATVESVQRAMETEWEGKTDEQGE